MTKSEIVDRIKDQTGLSAKQSAELLESFLEVIKITLESGENLTISGFGKFSVRQKDDRIGRNPQTGENIKIGSRKVLTFKPSMKLREALNKYS